MPPLTLALIRTGGDPRKKIIEERFRRQRSEQKRFISVAHHHSREIHKKDFCPPLLGRPVSLGQNLLSDCGGKNTQGTSGVIIKNHPMEGKYRELSAIQCIGTHLGGPPDDLAWGATEFLDKIGGYGEIIPKGSGMVGVTRKISDH